MSRAITPLCYTLALIMAGVAGIADVHNADVQAAVILVSGSSFVVSALRPRHAWIFAVIIGAGVPAAHFIWKQEGRTLPYTVSSPAAPFLALLPAFIGAYAAVAIRKVLAAGKESE